MNALVASLVTFLATPVQAELPPVFPISTNSRVYGIAAEISAATAKGDFSKAERLSKLLPKTALTYRIQTAGLSQADRAKWVNVIQFAATKWGSRLGLGHSLTQVKTGPVDLVFAFSPVLAQRAGSDLPAGAAWFWTKDPTVPSEIVFGLKRDRPLRTPTESEMLREAYYALGAAYGLSDHIINGHFMNRTDGAIPNGPEPGPNDGVLVREIIARCEEIRKTIRAKTPVYFGRPRVTVQAKSVDFGSVIQGAQPFQLLTVSNQGDAPLLLAAAGDCSCISGGVVPRLEPGQSAALRVNYDTRELAGKVEHGVIFSTNDPEAPIQKISARIWVEPRAAIFFESAPYLDLDEKSRTLIAYLKGQPQDDLRVEAAAVSGLEATVTAEPFEGVAHDHTSQVPAGAFKGYKLTIDLSKVDPKVIFGRSIGNLFVRTNLPDLKIVRENIYVQRGVVLSPESIFFGTPSGPVRTTLTLSKPNKDWKIGQITSTSKYVTAQIRKLRKAGEYVIDVRYDGKAPEHALRGMLTIRTDLPRQPTIQVPFESGLR